MRIVLLGAPGSGKGTQSQLLQRRAGIPQISTGDLLRAAVARGTELGRQAKEAMDSGRLVDDTLVLGMISERLGEPDTARGFILDGFPRNLAQAHALDRLLQALGQPLDAVVQLEVDYSELVRRISGRRTCADCGRVFNLLTSPPAGQDQVCPKTGTAHRLVQRPDDNEATVTERLRVYEDKTRPLIDFYRARGLLRVINAQGDVNEVARRLADALDLPAPSAARARRTAKPTPRKGTRRNAPRGAAIRAKVARRKATRSRSAAGAGQRGGSSRPQAPSRRRARPGASRVTKAKASPGKQRNRRQRKPR